MKPIKVKAGQKLKIKVPIKGAPPPEVAWAKGGVVLKPKPKRRPPTKEEEAEMVKLKGFTKSKSCHCPLQSSLLSCFCPSGAWPVTTSLFTTKVFVIAFDDMVGIEMALENVKDVEAFDEWNKKRKYSTARADKSLDCTRYYFARGGNLVDAVHGTLCADLSH